MDLHELTSEKRQASSRIKENAMRYRLKVKVIVELHGRRYTLEKYFRAGSPNAVQRKKLKFVQNLEKQGYILIEETSEGYWVG